MQAVMDAREKEFQEKMKVMQERLQQLEANKVVFTRLVIMGSVWIYAGFSL